MTWRAMVLLPLALAACSEDPPETEIEDRPVPPIHTPRWAFEPWISKDISTADDTRAFVSGFFERSIPVGVVVLDSPWETSYNTFVPDPARYPGFGPLVDELKQRDVRVVLWMTQMVNESSFDSEDGGSTYDGPASNFLEGEAKGYYVNGAQRFFWWKGVGCGLDFFNPDAIRWWHRQQDSLLDLGVAGWKLDFGDGYVNTATVATHAGTVPHQAYSEAYYRDFYAYGVNRQGREGFVTMVRPYDKSYQFEGRFYAKKEHAPVAWVGDNRRDYVGLEDALDHLFRSARAGYVVIGSDVGGYLDRDDRDLIGTRVPFDTTVFARWTAVGALTPFMQLHGRANIAPWTVPDRAEEMTAAYRYWATLHHELVPFFYSLAEEAYAGAQPILRPVGDESAWAGDWRFEIGDAFLVAPVLSPSGAREVKLPDGARWYDWWDPALELEGGAVVTASVGRDLQRSPLYLKAGAIVPRAKADRLEVLVVPGEVPSRFVLHDGDAAIELRAAPGTIEIGAGLGSAVFRVRAPTSAQSVRAVVDGAAAPMVASEAALAPGVLSAFFDRAAHWALISAPAGAARIELTFE